MSKTESWIHLLSPMLHPRAYLIPQNIATDKGWYKEISLIPDASVIKVPPINGMQMSAGVFLPSKTEIRWSQTLHSIPCGSLRESPRFLQILRGWFLLVISISEFPFSLNKVNLWITLPFWTCCFQQDLNEKLSCFLHPHNHCIIAWYLCAHTETSFKMGCGVGREVGCFLLGAVCCLRGLHIP